MLKKKRWIRLLVFLLLMFIGTGTTEISHHLGVQTVQAAAMKTKIKSGKTVYSITYSDKLQKTVIYKKTGNRKKKLIGRMNGGEGGSTLLFKYGNKLYGDVWGADCAHLFYLNLSNKKVKSCNPDGGCMFINRNGFKRYGRYLPFLSAKGYTEISYEPYRVWDTDLCVLDLKTGKRIVIQKNCRYAAVCGKKLYYVKVCRAYEGIQADVQVMRCTLNGKSKKNMCSAFRIYGEISNLTKKSITYKSTNGRSCTKNYVQSVKPTAVPTVNPAIRFQASGTVGNKTCKLQVNTTPGSQNVTWKSSDSSIASVSNGTITARKAGTVTITASMTYGGKVYSAKKMVTIGSRKTYGNWSAWSLDAATPSSTLEVQKTALYRYYYFYCPVCGGREPYQGKSDCKQYSLSLADGHVGWFPTPYSMCNPQPYSYTTAKRYTTSLGDGQIWNFTTAEINCNMIGYYSEDALDIIIRQGYRTRRINTSCYVKSVQ